MKLALALAPLAALIIFTLLLSFQLAGAPIGEDESISLLVMVSLMLAVMIAAVQVAALGLLRLLRWQGPSLKVEGQDELRRVFE